MFVGIDSEWSALCLEFRAQVFEAHLLPPLVGLIYIAHYTHVFHIKYGCKHIEESNLCYLNNLYRLNNL